VAYSGKNRGAAEERTNQGTRWVRRKRFPLISVCEGVLAQKERETLYPWSQAKRGSGEKVPKKWFASGTSGAGAGAEKTSPEVGGAQAGERPRNRVEGV